jgi:hypothetical protein
MARAKLLRKWFFIARLFQGARPPGCGQPRETPSQLKRGGTAEKGVSAVP